MPSRLSELDVCAPHVDEANCFSSNRIQYARKFLQDRFPSDADVDLVAFGSLARREATTESDFDYLVLVDGLPTDASTPLKVGNAAQDLLTEWSFADGQGEPVRPPGASGLFGDVVGAFDLIENVGLQRDTNHTLTRRMLLMEESVGLLPSGLRERALEAALDRYLLHVHEDAVPRFLLNDVLRYWRTITVDYQAKVTTGQKAGLRYLKLLIPRKVQFASTLMCLLLCGKLDGHTATVGSLRQQLDLSPLERLLAAHEQANEEVREQMRVVVQVVDHYLKCSSERSWREAVTERPISPEPGTTEFEDMRQHARLLQTALQTIFFKWELLAADSQEKLVF